MTEPVDLDKWLSRADLEARDNAIATNDRFILAMAKAARSGREKVTPGIYVDTTPPVFAKRYRPEVAISACGSPADACTRAHVNGVGSRVLMK